MLAKSAHVAQIYIVNAIKRNDDTDCNVNFAIAQFKAYIAIPKSTNQYIIISFLFFIYKLLKLLHHLFDFSKSCTIELWGSNIDIILS